MRNRWECKEHKTLLYGSVQKIRERTGNRTERQTLVAMVKQRNDEKSDVDEKRFHRNMEILWDRRLPN